jgi:hypothetical protein
MIEETRKRHAKRKAAAHADQLQSEVEDGDAEAPVANMTAQDASSYILGMAAELKRLADASGFRFLAYLLEMVFQEAFRLTSEGERSERREEKPARAGSRPAG